ncbi:hypothetical protein FZEAL_5572 [Fusarium zealandicum]|uniref:Amine oxidase n=1 Tax=Fusarium zealandicum TaxID=1053134 RepID=A0A8H4UJE4_9HYPO|nr:hypothetical protein FZEAL_5572 [Fusarium zealandicum]
MATSGTRLLSSLLLFMGSLPSASITVNGESHPEQPVDVDVVVVGGGFSGLMSAYDLHQSGLTTVVLEAKETIGGRSRTHQLKSGPGLVELGATWINNMTQPAIFALSEDLGLETSEQYTEGDEISQGLDGKVQRVSPGDQPNGTVEEMAALKLVESLYGLIEEASNKTDLYNMDQFPSNEDVSLAEWVEQKGLWKCGLGDLSSEGKMGAQSLKIKKGTTAISTGLADALPPANVLVKHPVGAITQDCNNTVLVTAATGQTFRAKRVIIAIPSHMYAGIKFSPPLPRKQNTLVSHIKGGVYAKMILSYTEPWWRNAGLIGKFSSLVGPVCLSWDTSDPELSQYSLAIFVAGDIADRWHGLCESRRKKAIVEHLAVLVGEELADRARDTVEVNYAEWTNEEYILGAPTGTMGPGVLRKYGTALREPFRSLHFGEGIYGGSHPGRSESG